MTMKLSLIYRREYGHHRFYPADEVTTILLATFHKKTLTLQQLHDLQGIGFEVDLYEEKPDL